MNIQKVNLKEKFDSFSDHWNPRIVGELNGQHVKVVKLKDEFIMHHHEDEDELFLVIEGVLEMEMEDQTLEIHPGEFVIIPRGVAHLPRAIGEVKILLFEPKSTLNTGNLKNDRTREDLESI